MYDFVDETSTQSGTSMNRVAMMAVQGFIGNNFECLSEDKFKITNSEGQVMTITYNQSTGCITETFTGEKTITNNINFNGDGKITGVLS